VSGLIEWYNLDARSGAPVAEVYAMHNKALRANAIGLGTRDSSCGTVDLVLRSTLQAAGFGYGSPLTYRP
jgi:hypothetical protein